MDLLSEAGDTGSDGHHESHDAEGSVDGHQRRPERCRCALAAQQDNEAEEPNHKLQNPELRHFQDNTIFCQKGVMVSKNTYGSPIT